MNMKNRFWTRLGKTCSLLVAIWIRFIKLLNRSKILKAVNIDTSEEDLTSLLENVLEEIKEFDSEKHFEQMKVSK